MGRINTNGIDIKIGIKPKTYPAQSANSADRDGDGLILFYMESKNVPFGDILVPKDPDKLNQKIIKADSFAPRTNPSGLHGNPMGFKEIPLTEIKLPGQTRDDTSTKKQALSEAA